MTNRENGFRNLSNSKHAVTKWEDFSDLKVCVMQSNICQNLGANATLMAFAEVEIFSALATNTIDAQSPYVTIDTSKFYETQKYICQDEPHTPTRLVSFLFSTPIFDSYKPKRRPSLRECAIVSRNEEREVIDELKARGH